MLSLEGFSCTYMSFLYFQNKAFCSKRQTLRCKKQLLGQLQYYKKIPISKHFINDGLHTQKLHVEQGIQKPRTFYFSCHTSLVFLALFENSTLLKNHFNYLHITQQPLIIIIVSIQQLLYFHGLKFVFPDKISNRSSQKVKDTNLLLCFSLMPNFLGFSKLTSMSHLD